MEPHPLTAGLREIEIWSSGVGELPAEAVDEAREGVAQGPKDGSATPLPLPFFSVGQGHYGLFYLSGRNVVPKGF